MRFNIYISGEKTAIITQNENGPCPLLAILNALLLKGNTVDPALSDLIMFNSVKLSQLFISLWFHSTVSLLLNEVSILVMCRLCIG